MNKLKETQVKLSRKIGEVECSYAFWTFFVYSRIKNGRGQIDRNRKAGIFGVNRENCCHENGKRVWKESNNDYSDYLLG